MPKTRKNRRKENEYVYDSDVDSSKGEACVYVIVLSELLFMYVYSVRRNWYLQDGPVYSLLQPPEQLLAPFIVDKDFMGCSTSRNPYMMQ